jgi:hypothetical protein
MITAAGGDALRRRVRHVTAAMELHQVGSFNNILHFPHLPLVSSLSSVQGRLDMLDLGG